RIHARMTPGTYTALYQTAAIKGSAEPATGRLTIYVIADDVANQPPKPKQVEIRTLIGRPVVISIPLDGIDPNGDFVSLVGLGSAPEKGQITEVTSTGFVYSPGDTTDGNDEFTYVVADRRGLEAVGRVVIGIASANDSNAPPIALTDIIETRPGREVAIPVTANDSDPNGKPCCVLVADSVTSDDFTAFTRDNDVVVTVPTTPGSYWGTYEVANASGLTSTGMIVVVVNPDLKLRPPILGDDVVTAAEVLTLDSVTLSVRDNDRDPDGDVMTTTVSVADPTLIVDGGMVTVPITAELQILDYWLTNQDGLVGHGFITVPGRETTPPQIDPSTIGIEVKQGDSVTFLLSDHIIVRPGRTPRVTEAAKISAWHGAAEAVSITELSFQAPQDYAGPAAVTLEVTDGETLEDSTGLRNIVSIPVTIIPRVGDEKNYLVHIEDAAIEVEVGQSTSLNLAGLVTGVQQLAILVFSITDETRPAGMDISLSGSTLSASSNVNVPKGTVARVSVKVTAGSYSDEGQVTVTVVGSKKPLAVAVNDFVPDANQGQQTCVNVVANDTNPFPGQPLTVVEALVESGRGMAVIGCGNGGVAVTPAPDFLGEMVVRYTIQDATEDPDRQVQGRIFLTVRGKPDPPTGLHIDKVDNKLVILSWLPPNNNGTPITGYTVTSDNGYVKQCPATTCSLDGLQNDVPYKFRVTATNEVGTSDPSEWSDEARPDIVPFPLEAPDIKFGDKSLVLTWIPKGSDGSPVTSYDLMIEPAPGSGPSIINTTKTSYTWTGLVNGTEYRVRVCAKNKAPGVCEEDSHWSPLSRGEIPAGVPDAPVAPTWTRLNPVGAERQVRVCWNTPYQNGDAISTYTLRSSTGVIYEAAATGNSTCVTTTLPTSTTAYTFTVAGTNKAGQGAFSPPSSGFRAVNPPGAVSGALVVDKDEACQISFNPAALNGASASEVTYHWRASCGCAGDFGTHTSGTTDTWMSNAETVTIYVWASTTVQGNTENGPEIVAGTCSPYGLPLAPGLSATTGVNTAQYTWSPPSANGRPVSSMQVSINNGTWTTLGSLSGTATLGSGCGLSYDVKVRAVDSLGQIGAVTQRTATTQSCVQPSITMGLTGTKCQYTVGTECYVMWVETHDFVGNATCQIVSTSVGLNERWKPWTQGPNERKQPGPGVGHRVVVKIDCTDGGTGQFVTSGNYQMP
ncbi:MAG: fibronectin type III domain-containing protein, partial [Propionibacteriaceae bacterium]|nr:fibronectin type III domain-containing protein [Propionibacteriaceae bacterium]